MYVNSLRQYWLQFISFNRHYDRQCPSLHSPWQLLRFPPTSLECTEVPLPVRYTAAVLVYKGVQVHRAQYYPVRETPLHLLEAVE